MASNLGNLVASATLDIAPFQTNTKNLKTYMRSLDNSLKAVEKSFDSHGSKLRGQKAIYNETKQALRGYQGLLQKQTDKFNSLKAEIGDVSKATAKQKADLIGAKEKMMESAAKVSELQGRLRALATESSVFTKLGNGATYFGNRLKDVGQSLSGVGSALTRGVTAPIVAGAGYALKAAVDYESAFAGVKKTVDETATTSYAKLSSNIRKMATELPASATEIARVAESAGQLGIKADDIVSFTRTMIDMGESTNLSAEDAATSIAKIANITGLSSKEYSRFGASVVALGNNFATTERDIVEMANRLAASGKIAGLTNQEILGLSTAMSSVGIEAEAGGTAMSQTLQKIEKAVIDGGEKLEGFATVAGMSAEDFANKWKTKPAEAIESFLKGLGRLDKEGASLTAILDDLGLKGIRQGNMVKSLALASDTLSGALNLSNKAWDENSALTNEASKRYETTASKLKILKNKATDVAIEFGGPLVGALNDGIDAVKPWIQQASELAKKFSSLDKEQQRQIIKWGLMAAAAGPALSIIGKGVGVIGSAFTTLGTVSKGIGKLSGILQTSGKAMGAIETSAGAAEGAIGGLGGAVGLLGNPVTWGVLIGGAAIAGITYLSLKAQEAKTRTEAWGTAVSKLEAEELSNFKLKVDETNHAMASFGTDAISEVGKVKKAFQELSDEVIKLTDKELAKDLKLAEKWGLSDEQINRMKSQAEQTKKNAQTMSDEVIAIYKNANANHRKLSEEEKSIVLNNQTELINKQLELMNFSKSERIAIQKAMNGELEGLNATQLQNALKTTSEWLEKENSAYKKSKAELKELLQSGALNQEQYNKKLETLQADHTAKMETYGDRYVKIQKQLAAKQNFADLDEYNNYYANIEANMKKLSLSYEDYEKSLQSAAEKTKSTSGLIAQYTANMSEEAKMASTHWNSIVLDPKTGEIKTNAQEEIQKALQAEGGWKAIQFDLKNANMTTNAKIAVGEALVANGQWSSLSPAEKALVVDGKPAVAALLDSKSNLVIWNSMPAEIKKILGSNESFLSSKEGAEQALNAWNMMTPTQKALTAQNLTSGDVALAQQTVDSLTGKTVPLDAQNNTIDNVISANAAVNSVKQNTPAAIKASNNTGVDVSAAKTSIASVPSSTKTYLNAVDNVSGTVSGILSSLGGLAAKAYSIAIGLATGTNYHPGGLAVVNDQKGSTYEELVTLPNGYSFIPEGRNVMLPLPRGSKVLKASDTKRLIPRYADGIGFENTRIASLTERMGKVQTVSTPTTSNSGSSLESKFASLVQANFATLEAIERVLDRPIYLVMDDGTLIGKIGNKMSNFQSRQQNIELRMRGGASG